jgi:endonuclease/exonuclease/phosphatase family metal-dependent hydrolase
MRIMTYNIRGGLGMDGKRSIRRIALVLREAGSDVVGLQEVHQRLPQSGLRDQPHALGRATGMSCLFGPAIAFGPGRYGNAVLSSIPARLRRLHPLPGEGEPRGAMEVEVSMDGRPLILFCTHFGLTTTARGEQAAALAEAVRLVEGPSVVLGDLNAGPEAPELRPLYDVGLRHAAPPVEPTFPSNKPITRIDHMLVSSELVGMKSWTVPTMASDHLPVAAEIGWASGFRTFPQGWTG